MATSSNIFEVGKVYSFTMYASNILQASYHAVTCKGVFNHEVARSMLVDIDAMHARVYPYLPAGTPDSASVYQYAAFQEHNGNTIILGLPWININTIRVVDTQEITVTIKGKTASYLNELRQILTENNVGEFDIQLTNRS